MDFIFDLPSFLEKVELILKKDIERHFSVIIENYEQFGSTRLIIEKLPPETLVGDALTRIATKEVVGIPKDQVETFELFNPNTNIILEKQSTLASLKNGVQNHSSIFQIEFIL